MIEMPQFTASNSGLNSTKAGNLSRDSAGSSKFGRQPRMLVMVDGIRVPGGDANNQVDVSLIPQLLVSRVETITGAASAQYGVPMQLLEPQILFLIPDFGDKN
jgi:iron complex outermembrane receptor protein